MGLKLSSGVPESLRPHERHHSMILKRSTILICSAITAAVVGTILLLLSVGYVDHRPPPKEMQFQAEVDLLEYTLSEYHKEFGKYPPIENAALIDSLLGDNPSHREFIFRTSLQLNNKKEAVDPWGKPMRFIQAKDSIEVENDPKLFH